MRIYAFLLLLMGITGSAAAQSPLPPATFANVSYGTDERHVLDLWQADSDESAPLLIFIHGGGWAGGGKEDLPPKLLQTMLGNGISVASINYRLTPQSPLPAPVHDAAKAVQFLRTKAREWRLDPQRFGAYGISAGATTSLWLAYHADLATKPGEASSRLNVAVALSPQTCLEPQIAAEWVGEQVLNHPMMARAVAAKNLDEMKNPRPEWVKLLREFSPITHVSKDDPPVMVQNPRADPLPAATAGSAIHHAIFGVKLKEKCDAVGAKCILRLQDMPEGAPEPEAFLIENLRQLP